MTLLASIAHHQIHLDCPCGHHGVVEVVDLLAAGRHSWQVADVVARSRCRGCGQRGGARVTLSWAGNGRDAMKGARTREQDNPKNGDQTS